MDTDFGTPSKLLTDGHFSIVKICTAEKSLTDCWKTEASGNDKVTYRRIDGRNANNISLKRLTIILKNGIMFGYGASSNYGNLRVFVVDINGNDKPNIIGRDLFGFYID